MLKWYFDTPTGSEYAAQGNHNLSVNDVDGDGFDEIIYGSLTMDHDGTPLYTTGLGHGDAMHVSDWNGDGKLEVFQVHEEKKAAYGLELHDAATGEVLWGVLEHDQQRCVRLPGKCAAGCEAAQRQLLYLLGRGSADGAV